jgi:hypothetical protein
LIQQPVTELVSLGLNKTGQAEREGKFRKTTDHVTDHVA